MRAANMLLKFKFGLIFLFILSASLFSVAFAARRTPQLSKRAAIAVAAHQEVGEEEEEVVIHERLLRVNTKDYGKYDPAPALVRPPFKLIPN